MTQLEKKEFKLGRERFAFHYKTFDQMIQDFEKWVSVANAKTEKVAKQTANNLKEIWLRIDSRLSLYPNKLASLNDIEDNFFLPLYIKIRENAKTEIPNKDLKPSTVMGKLSSIRSLLDFITSRDIFIGNLY